MSDRLKELQRQRSLAQEQVAWFDREIARETFGKAQVPAQAPAVAKAETPGIPQPAAPSADDIIAQYQSQAKPMHSEVKRGCFLYFFAAFGLLILALMGFYFLGRR